VNENQDHFGALAEDRLRFLVEAGRVLASSLDPEQTLRQLTRLAVPRIADWCAIYLTERGEPRLVEVAHRDPERLAAARTLRERYPLDRNAPHGVHAVLRSGEPDLLPEITPEMVRGGAVDEEHARLLAALDLRSLLTVPLVARGATIGAITLVRGSSGRRFDADDTEFARELGHRAGLAVDNARLYAEAARRADEEAALRRATVAVAASGTVDEVIQAIAEGALVAVGADGAFVERISKGAEEMEVIAVRGAHTPPEGARAALAGSCAERALRDGEPVSVTDLRSEGSALLHAIGAECARCSALVLPLQDGGEPIGTLVLVRSTEGFTAKETQQGATFAHLATLAFRRLHLLHETESRREELERVTESRARLMRGFSHDVKNPLGAADGHLELLEEGILGPLNPRQNESVRRSRAAIRSALELIADLVELARAEATLIKIERCPVDLAGLVRDVTEEHRPAAELKGLTLALDLPPRVPLIESDSSRVRQILGNLISNAVKYTDHGEVRVVLETGTQHGGRRGLAARVIDSGRGIPSATRHLLFQEFGKISRDREGMGLGLAISLRLARALGGDVTAESEPGKGSTFTLWLPLERGQAADRVA
jgi:signal transduction histidine kinase